MPSQRYLKSTPATLLKVPDPERELILSLTHLVTKYPPQNTYDMFECKGLYHGPTAIAYLFLHLTLTHPDLEIAKSRPSDWCSMYLSGTRHEVPIDPDHCGVINEAFVHLAVSAAVSKDAVRVHKFVALSHDSAVLKPQSGGSCEWLYGRAGTLYLLRLMRVFVPACTDIIDTTIKDLVKVVMEIKGVKGGWKWHGKEYLGAAHGKIGIVTQVALSCDALDSKRKWEVQERVLGPLEDVLKSLLGKQRDDGNWPTREDSGDEKDELVQFCHGAPGFVVSFQALMDRRLFLEIQGIDEAVKKARKAIWERGQLKKEPCLCHGITGNALALSGEQREHFLAYTTQEMVRDLQNEGLFEHSSDPWGLYGGLPGRAWGFIELLREKEGISGGYRGFIGYSDV